MFAYVHVRANLLLRRNVVVFWFLFFYRILKYRKSEVAPSYFTIAVVLWGGYLLGCAFASYGTRGNSWRYFCLSQLGREDVCVTGIQQVEASYATEHLQCRGPPPATGKCPAQNVSSAKSEKLSSVESRIIEQTDKKVQNREDLSFWRQRSYSPPVLNALEEVREKFTSTESLSLSISDFTILNHISTLVIVCLTSFWLYF